MSPSTNQDEQKTMLAHLKSIVRLISLFAGLLVFFICYNPHASAFSFRSSLMSTFIFSLILSIALYFYIFWLLSFTRYRSLIIQNNQNVVKKAGLTSDENFYQKYILPAGPLNLDARWDLCRPPKNTQQFMNADNHITSNNADSFSNLNYQQNTLSEAFESYDRQNN